MNKQLVFRDIYGNEYETEEVNNMNPYEIEDKMIHVDEGFYYR
jgi:hypothetical protein